jgi:hypothetical protein
VLHGGIVEVDLEPVPDEHGRAGESQDVQHDAPVQVSVVGPVCRTGLAPSMSWVTPSGMFPDGVTQASRC